MVQANNGNNVPFVDSSKTNSGMIVTSSLCGLTQQIPRSHKDFRLIWFTRIELLISQKSLNVQEERCRVLLGLEKAVGAVKGELRFSPKMD